MLSRNEEHCTRMNKLATNNKDKLVFVYNRHSRQSRRMLTDVIDQLERTDDMIRLSTGSLFSPEEAFYLNQQLIAKENKKRQNREKKSTLVEFQEVTNSLTTPRLTKSMTEINLNTLRRQHQNNPTSSLYNSKTDEIINASIDKFMDKDNKVSYKINRNEMKLIECKHSAFRAIEDMHKRYDTRYKNDVFHELRIFGNIELDRNFEFNDEEVYKRYVGLCEVRDSIPETGKKRIEALKKRDPVFARRFGEYVSLRTKYRAPRFEPHNSVYLPPVPKLTLTKNKERFIKEMSYHHKVNLPMLKMQRVIERSKEFMRNIDQTN